MAGQCSFIRAQVAALCVHAMFMGPCQTQQEQLQSCWLYRWGPKLLEQGLGGSRALQRDTALAVAQAHCTAAEKVGGAGSPGDPKSLGGLGIPWRTLNTRRLDLCCLRSVCSGRTLPMRPNLIIVVVLRDASPLRLPGVIRFR